MLRNTPALDGQVCSKLCYLRLVYSRVDSSSGYQAFYFALCCMLSMRFLSSQFQSIAAERLVTKRRGKKWGRPICNNGFKRGGWKNVCVEMWWVTVDIRIYWVVWVVSVSMLFAPSWFVMSLRTMFSKIFGNDGGERDGAVIRWVSPVPWREDRGDICATPIVRDVLRDCLKKIWRMRSRMRETLLRKKRRDVVGASWSLSVQCLRCLP